MRNDSFETSTDIRRTLGLDEPADGHRRLLPWVLTAVLLALAALAALAGLLRVPFVFNPGIVILSLPFSAAVGVVFGYFPARKAARLDPIDALRHE